MGIVKSADGMKASIMDAWEAQELRGAGVETSGPKSFGTKERQKFANELDKILSQRL